MTELIQQKKVLRAKINGYKNSFTTEELRQKSERIVEKLKHDTAFITAKTVMLYWSLPDEVHTHTLIADVLKTKTVVLPTIVNDLLIPVKLNDITNLREGKFHILEPQNSVFTDKIDLIVVPGIAFDRAGNRLGRGRGFYDRFLQYQTAKTIGICFDFQLVEEIPTEAKDIPIGKIISE